MVPQRHCPENGSEERRLVATRDPQGRTVTQKWCNCGVLEKIIDTNGNATSWSLDAQNRVTQETRANAGTIAQVYETTTSRLKRRTNLKGELADYTYFKDNNVNTVSYPNPGKPTSNVRASALILSKMRIPFLINIHRKGLQALKCAYSSTHARLNCRLVPIRCPGKSP